MSSTKQVTAGGVAIGGGAPLTIQSMLNTPAADTQSAVRQAVALEQAGCDIVRVAIPDRDSVALIPALKQAVRMPVVADIHFDYRLALESASAGVDKLRINPGNIGGAEHVRAVAKTCCEKGIPIRIGVNAGSLEKHILARHGHPSAQALVESALYHASLLEQADFDDIVLSMKASSVAMTMQAYRLAAEQSRYPLHIGVTEAGTLRTGLIKSAVALGGLLLDGIGDTLRVSLTADPVEEIHAAKDILKAVGLGKGPTVISCPTCGRTKINLIPLAEEVENALAHCSLNITVAVMGCAVNGPGEAREADLGIAGGDGSAVLFARGTVIGTVPQDRIVPALLEQIELLEQES